MVSEPNIMTGECQRYGDGRWDAILTYNRDQLRVSHPTATVWLSVSTMGRSCVWSATATSGLTCRCAEGSDGVGVPTIEEWVARPRVAAGNLVEAFGIALMGVKCVLITGLRRRCCWRAAHGLAGYARNSQDVHILASAKN
jgi:hypothetical protein